MSDHADRQNELVKKRFSEGLERHVKTCSVCQLQGARNGCLSGRLLMRAAQYGSRVPNGEPSPETDAETLQGLVDQPRAGSRTPLRTPPRK